MDEQFVGYAFQDLPRKKVVKYAAQYDGVNMARLMGADEENFPFHIQDGDKSYFIMFWNVHNGIMANLDEDTARAYATANYLKEHAYPVFASFQEAERYAREHDWPRKVRLGGSSIADGSLPAIRVPETTGFGASLQSNEIPLKRPGKPSQCPSRNQRPWPSPNRRVPGRAVPSVVFCPFSTGRPGRGSSGESPMISARVFQGPMPSESASARTGRNAAHPRNQKVPDPAVIESPKREFQ